MSNYPESFIPFSKDLMKRMGKDIQRWSNDPNPVIAKAFRDVLDASKAQE